MNDKPKEILSTADLLDCGPSCGGYEGEMQYRHALQDEFDKRNAAEKLCAELKAKVKDLEQYIPNAPELIADANKHLTERLTQINIENAALRAQVERLSAPVTEAEVVNINLCNLERSLNALLAARKERQ
jgi:hypothetical protein